MSKRHRPPALPANNDPKQVVTQGSFQTISSPYPLPIQLDSFEEYAPGSAAEVIKTAQESIRHQERMQELAIKGQIDHDRGIREGDQHKNTTIRWVLILAIGGAFVLAYLNKDTASYVLLFSGLAALVGALFYSKKKQ